MTDKQLTPDEMALEVKRLTEQLQAAGRKDLLLRAIGVPLLEELRLEAAKGNLSRLLITKDYRFILSDYGREVELQPVHRAVYLLFLAHPEGIEFKRLSEYHDELYHYYERTAPFLDRQKLEDSLNHLTNPLDNAINEKCSRIKKAFGELMDEYTASYYMISGHAQKRISGTNHVWFERRKIITLPRELVIWETAETNH